MRFPRATKAIRFRTAKAGQKLVGLEFYYYGHAHAFHVPFRFITLRTPYTENGQAFCIVDLHPHNNDQMREAVGQKCAHAEEIADARNIWFKHDFPNYKRIYGVWNMHISFVNLTEPFVARLDWRDNSTWFENLNENSL